MATDGGLTERGKQIDFVSGDSEQVQTFIHCLPRRRPRRYQTAGKRNTEYRTQFNVPDDLLSDAVRGLLDGDGSIYNKVSRYGSNGRGEPYFWEALVTKFHSASLKHDSWLRQELDRSLGIHGFVYVDRNRKNPLYSLRSAKHESLRLLACLYSELDSPCLVRKRSIWDDYRERHGMDGAASPRDDDAARVAESG